MLSWVQRRASGRNVLILLFMVLVFNLMILPWAGERLVTYSGGSGPLDLSFGFTPDEAYRRIAAFGPDGRSFYLLFELTGDVLWPIVYSFFFATLLAYLFARGFSPTSPMQRLILVPFLGLAADFAENIGIIAMLLAFPDRLDSVAQLTSAMQIVKWLLAGVTVLLVLVGAVAALARRRNPQPSKVG